VDLPFDWRCPCVSLNLLYYNDDSTSTVPRGVCLACLSVLCVGGQGLCHFSWLDYDLLSRSGYTRDRPEGALPKSVSSHTV